MHRDEIETDIVWNAQLWGHKWNVLTLMPGTRVRVLIGRLHNSRRTVAEAQLIRDGYVLAVRPLPLHTARALTGSDGNEQRMANTA